MNQNLNQSAVIEEISPAEAAGVFGGIRGPYSRKIYKKKFMKLKRLKKSIYLVKYRQIIKNKKKTVSQTNYRPAGNWSFS